MKTLLINASISLTIACMVSPSAHAADPLFTCVGYQHAPACRGLVGKRFWIAVSKVAEGDVSFQPDDHSASVTLMDGSFQIIGFRDGDNHQIIFSVKLPDGRIGSINASRALVWLREGDPADDASKAIARKEECARRGQPKIGMSNDELIGTCWGRPIRVVKKTTASGVEESYVYGIGHIVKFNNGKVSEIVEARQ